MDLKVSWETIQEQTTTWEEGIEGQALIIQTQEYDYGGTEQK